MSETVFTYCRICETRCGLAVTVADGRVERIEPDREHVHGWRDFCSKGRTAHQLVEHPRRLRTPMKRVGDRYEAVSWEQATREIADSLNSIIERDGADAVAMYMGNPCGLSFSHGMFASGLMDGIGSTSRYTVGSVDQHGEQLVCELMYGTLLFPLVPDVDDCDCFLFLGMNPAESAFNWIGSVPNGWRRVLARQADGADLIVVDPRRTKTAERADLHISLRPGTDWAMLLGVLKVIVEQGWTHEQDCAAASGYEQVVRLVADADLERLSRVCEVPVQVIRDVARRFGTARTAVAWGHTGVAHTPTGTVAIWLINLLSLVTGRLDRPGGRHFERGYLDSGKVWSQLVPRIEGPSRVRGLPKVVNTVSLAELPGEITTPGAGQVRALFIMAGNPVVSGPDGGALDAALAELDLLIAVDMLQRESHRHAHWLIPGSHWLEREELSPLWSSTEESPFVQFGFRAVPPPEGLKEEWEFFTDLTLAMRRPMFGKPGVNAVIRASRWLARVTRRPELAFSQHWPTWAMVRMGGRLKWRDIKRRPHGWAYAEKEFGAMRDHLLTPDKRVHAAPEPLLREVRRLMTRDPAPVDTERPFLMVTRRRVDSMNSWLNDLPGLHTRSRHNSVEIHPDDAASLGIATGDEVEVRSATGSVMVPAKVTDLVMSGVVAVEHGWGSGVFDPAGREPAQRYGVNRNQLVSNTDLDPLSQIPALNSTAVSIRRCGRAGPGER